MQTRPDDRRGEGYCIDMLEGGWRANEDGEARAALVGNNSGGRLDVEERAHGRGEHGGAGEGFCCGSGGGGAGEGDWVD